MAPLVSEYRNGRLVSSSGTSGGTGQRSGGGADRALWLRVTSVLQDAFLPEGYPESVSPDYLSFQAWDTVQALCSYVRGMLSSQAILKGVGVGQQAATPLGAVFQFFLRDLTGMLGAIIFGFFQGSSFDACAKQWRLFADVTNDIGMAVELASPFFPAAFFLPMLCFGSIARSVTGVAGGATRAALTQHFAQRGNAADISAKEQSQEIATTMAGMVLGMLFSRATADHAAAGWALFVVLTVLHVYANVRAMRTLVLHSLNQPRLDLLIARYYHHHPAAPSPATGSGAKGPAAVGGAAGAAAGGQGGPAEGGGPRARRQAKAAAGTQTGVGGGGGVALGPEQVSQLEDLTPPPFAAMLARLTGCALPRILFGARLSDIAPASPTASGTGEGDANGYGVDVAVLRSVIGSSCRPLTAAPLEGEASGGKPLLTTGDSADGVPGSGGNKAAGGDGAPTYLLARRRRGGVAVVLHRAATSDDMLQAYVHARVLSLVAQAQESSGGAGGEVAGEQGSGGGRGHGQGGGAAMGALRVSTAWMQRDYVGLRAALVQAGWHIGRLSLPRPVWTADWGRLQAHIE